MARVGSSPNFSDCLTVGEAAKFLGVSTATLRNWDRSGKLKPRRHPQNGYRIYLHADLEAVLRSAELADESVAPLVDWSEMSDSDHFVQFYESDEYLVESISGFVAAALNQGEASVVIAKPDHRVALQRRLVAQGIEVAAHIEAGRYVVLDAADTLAKFMVEGRPDPARFQSTVGSVIAQVSNGRRRVHAFGEMVALLWADGNRSAAIQLEQLWNELGRSYRFALFCAYPIQSFDDPSDAVSFGHVCSCHSSVIPSESYTLLGSAQDRLREVGILQQKAESLEAEILHRAEVEKVLRKREQELADFFDHATEGLHKVGPDGTILWANKAECDLLGYSIEEYVGRSIRDIHADEQIIEDILQRLHRGETLHNYAARLRCKNGAIKHVLISSNACFEDGRFAYTRCFTRDVTQQWEAEQALRQTIRRKDEFLATLSHELRNPLAPIRNSLEILRLARNCDDVFQQAHSVIDRQVQQMTRLVDDLLDVSRITRDQIHLRKQRSRLSEIIQNALETSRPLMESACHELSLSLPGDELFVNADPTRMAQVFSNLLNNAAKYTEPGGHIQVAAAREGDEIVVRVRDNGMGIPCDQLAYVFDMFRQVDGAKERAQGGLGIGLTLVRRLVELHGGSVSALSEGLGSGSEFVVRLPEDNTENTAMAEQALAAPVGAKKRILVVDDNADAGNTLGILLRLDGHEVRTAQDGLEAIEAVQEFAPDVILMDVGMPRLDGYEATRRIRQMPGGDKIFIVALTGWGQPTDREQSAEAGCSAHLVKPVDFAKLQQLLANGNSPR